MMGEFTKDIKSIVEQLSQLSEVAFEDYTHRVYEIINGEIKDENHIQRTLDGLLELCFDDNILLLFRKLCKYYYEINPQAALDYIEYYKEMYDSDGKKFGNNKTKALDE